MKIDKVLCGGACVIKAREQYSKSVYKKPEQIWLNQRRLIVEQFSQENQMAKKQFR